MFCFTGISKLLIGGRKELKKLIHGDHNSLARALLNSIKNHDLLMFRCLVQEFRADVTQKISLDDEKPTSFVLQAMAVEFPR